VSDDASVMKGWRDACSAAGDVRDRGDGAREPAEAAEEREWVRRCRQGDEAAFRELLRRYRGRALFLASQILRDRTEAEDVVQEAFLRVFRSIRTFRGDASFYSWLYRIVVNLCLDRGRRVPSRRTVALDPDQDVSDAADSRERFEPEAVETRMQVHALLAQLGDDLRVTLLLRELVGLSYEEIAGQLGVPIGTVRSRLSAAREQFRRLWARMEAE
jgi:RNA polymerase sigma-70 factor (ECF subfamily)